MNIVVSKHFSIMFYVFPKVRKLAVFIFSVPGDPVTVGLDDLYDGGIVFGL